MSESQSAEIDAAPPCGGCGVLAASWWICTPEACRALAHEQAALAKAEQSTSPARTEADRG